MRKARHFISREKQVFLVGFYLTFPRFSRISKNRLNTSLYFEQFTSNGFLDWYYERFWFTRFTMFPFYTTWNYPSNLRFSDVFREYKRETLIRNKSSFLTHRSPVFLFCTLLWTSKKLRSSIISRGYETGILRRNGWNCELSMLIFRELKNSFFKEQLSLTAFGFLMGCRGSLLHRVHGVHRQGSIGVQISNLQIQAVEKL